MTRETKVGLVVATTFLSLVGIVVASKLRRPDALGDQIVDVEESSAPGTPASGPGGQAASSPENKANGSGGKPTPNGGASPVAGGLPSVAGDPGKPGQPPKQPDPIGTEYGLPVVPAIAPVQPASVPAPLTQIKTPTEGLPSSSDPNPAKPAVGLPAAGLPAAGLPAVGLPAAGLPAAGLPAVGLPAAGLPAAGLPAAGLPAAGLPAAGLPPVEVDPLSLVPAKAVEPKKFTGPTIPSVPAVESVLISTPGEPSPAGKGPFADPIQIPQVPAIDPLKGKPDPMPVAPAVPAVDAIQPKIDLKPSAPMPPEKSMEPVGPPPLAPGVGFPPVPPTPAPKSPSIGTIGNPAADIPSTPPVTPSAPANSAPTPGAPMLPTGNKGLPPVTNHTEETRYTQPGDTSFDELSRKYYGTPSYGRALLEYNRRHVLAKTNLMQDPPLLQPNQPIYYPDKGILEIRYNQLIQNGSTTAPVSVLPTVKISAPTPLAGPGNVPALNPPTADATIAFRVAQPQFIFDIARQQLGDGTLWTEILRLNPALHTDQPIPAGTELRLPKLR
jgi:hypothetical protein